MRPGHDSKFELISINNQQQVKSFQGAFYTKQFLFVKAIEKGVVFNPLLYETRELRCMTEGLYC